MKLLNTKVFILAHRKHHLIENGVRSFVGLVTQLHGHCLLSSLIRYGYKYILLLMNIYSNKHVFTHDSSSGSLPVSLW